MTVSKLMSIFLVTDENIFTPLPFYYSIYLLLLYITSLNIRCVNLPMVNCHPFASEVVFCAILKNFEFTAYCPSKQNLSNFLLRGLKVKQCDFLGGNPSATGAVQKIHHSLVLLLRGTVNSKLKTFKITQNTTP